MLYHVAEQGAADGGVGIAFVHVYLADVFAVDTAGLAEETEDVALRQLVLLSLANVECRHAGLVRGAASWSGTNSSVCSFTYSGIVSSGPIIMNARPVASHRPVRPTRWMYSSSPTGRLAVYDVVHIGNVEGRARRGRYPRGCWSRRWRTDRPPPSRSRWSRAPCSMLTTQPSLRRKAAVRSTPSR